MLTVASGVNYVRKYIGKLLKLLYLERSGGLKIKG